MNCANCQIVNPDSAKFCMNCGAALTQVCPNCSTQLPAGAKICFNCGHQMSGAAQKVNFAEANLQQVIPGDLQAKLAAARASRTMEGERRVVTMLFCDVKGSTSMAETLDPEEWTGIMNQVFERMIAAVFKYEGTVARLMGDAILAFFGAPIAHEDDPQRAVLAGLAIVETIGPFRDELQHTRGLDFDVRVGINTGLVVVGEVGSDLRVEYTAMGDAVNLAARMEQTAQPGTVQIADNTYKLVRHFFEFESLGGIAVKGKKDPIPSYRALSPKVRPGQARGIEGLSSPLVGRDHELQALQAQIADLVAGKGQIVSVIGEAGLGKSRLVSELRRTIPESINWYEGRSVSYQTSTPFAMFISLFNSIFEPDGEEAGKYSRLKAQISRVALKQADKLAPFVGTLLGINPLGEDLERVKYLEPPQMRQGLFEAILEMVELIASRNPLVLVLDDLHWADPTSLDLLRLLVMLTNRVQLLVITLFRPHREDAAWQFHEAAGREYPHRYTALALEPLDESHARTLVANLLEIEDLPEKVRTLILNKSEGNPFFVEEVIRSLLDAKLVVRDGQHWRATRDVEKITVPDTLAGVITARLDRLNDDAKRAAQTAAVIGREFGFSTMEAVYESPSSLDGALTTLQQRELIREIERIPQPIYFFKHVLTQETAYGSLLLSKRRDLHRRVAECLEQTEPHLIGEIGWHFLEALEPGRSLPYLVAAGDQATRAYAVTEAMRFYQRALDILKTQMNLPLARRVYEGLGRIRFLAQDMPGAIATYQEMLALAESHVDPSMQVSALNKLSLMLGYAGQIAQTEPYLSQSEQLAQEANDTPGLMEMYVVRCQTALSIADFPTALKYLGESVTVGRELALDELRVFGLSHLSNTMTFIGRFDEAWKTAQECRSLAEQMGDRLHLAEVLAFPYPYHYLLDGDLDAAYDTAKQSSEIAESIGYGIGQFLSSLHLGMINQMRGDYEAALRHFRRGIAAANSVGIPLFSAVGLSSLGSVYLDISERFVEEINEVHLQATQLLQTPVGSAAGGWSWADLGFCTLARGDLDRAYECFQNGLNKPSVYILLQKPRHLVGLALVALGRDQLEEAARNITEARAYVEQNGMKHFFPLIALVEGRVHAAHGELKPALLAFAEAESLAQDMQMRPIMWQAQARAAQVLAGLSRTKEAGAKHHQANDVIQEIATLFRDEKLRAQYLESAQKKLDTPDQNFGQ